MSSTDHNLINYTVHLSKGDKPISILAQGYSVKENGVAVFFDTAGEVTHVFSPTAWAFIESEGPISVN